MTVLGSTAFGVGIGAIIRGLSFGPPGVAVGALIGGVLGYVIGDQQ